MRKLKEDMRLAIEASIAAGKEIMKIYLSENFEVERKADESPLTIADKRANKLIKNYLNKTSFPVISEEDKQISYDIRKRWKTCWIIDPLDGTKEFIKRNGEFTVNIALIEDGSPIFGVIYLPATKIIYAGDVKQKRAYRARINNVEAIASIFTEENLIEHTYHKEKIRVVGSRSHPSEEMEHFIHKTREENQKPIEIIPVGSSIKFCLVAEGLADIYPRFGPTMEWDTAAGQAICEAVGLEVIDLITSKKLLYNRRNPVNNPFLVSTIE